MKNSRREYEEYVKALIEINTVIHFQAFFVPGLPATDASCIQGARHVIE